MPTLTYNRGEQRYYKERYNLEHCGEFREWTFKDHSELLGHYPRFRLHSEVGSYHIGKAEPRERRVEE